MIARRGPRTFWPKLGLVALLGYCALAVIAAASVNGMIFQPRYGSFREPKEGAARLKLANGTELSLIYLPNPSARRTLWYFHGNAEDLGNVEPRLHQLRDLGYAVFAYDYPGYGLSGGQPSEKSICEATRAALAYLRETRGVTADRLVVYGRSLGSGPAVELAVNEPVAGLVLESAIMSVYRVVTRWRLLPFDQFENLRKIPRLRCPALVIHGRDDQVVPFHHGEALYKAIPTTKQHFWSDLAGHNDLEQIEGERYWAAIRKFSADIGAIPGAPEPPR